MPLLPTIDPAVTLNLKEQQELKRFLNNPRTALAYDSRLPERLKLAESLQNKGYISLESSIGHYQYFLLRQD